MYLDSLAPNPSYLDDCSLIRDGELACAAINPGCDQPRYCKDQSQAAVKNAAIKKTIGQK